VGAAAAAARHGQPYIMHTYYLIENKSMEWVDSIKWMKIH
jgi:hypothetical protein